MGQIIETGLSGRSINWLTNAQEITYTVWLFHWI